MEIKHKVVIEIEANSIQQLEEYLALIPNVYAEKLPLVLKQVPSTACHCCQINTEKFSYQHESSCGT